MLTEKLPVNIMLQAILFLSLMVGAAWVDIKKREIPPCICWLVAGISFLDFRPVHLLGVFAAIPLLIIATWIAPNRLGGGDIKLVAATGLVLGLQETNLAVVIGLALQVVVFLVISWLKCKEQQKLRERSLPLAPCLAFGFISIYILKLGGFIHEIF